MGGNKHMILFRTVTLYWVVFCSFLFGTEPAMSIAEHVKNVIPSVVKIKIQRSDTASDESELLSIDAGGSGFVMDTEHHIVTNAHVIKKAKKIIIIDSSDNEYPAELIGKDEKTDIAVIEVPSFNAPSLVSGEGTAVSVGDPLFVIGSPFSLGHSVSAGIVSAQNRFLPNYPSMFFLQTDASINPGNSGGPVLNLNGKLIGMASTYYSRQGNYTNVGFALPIEDVRRVAEELITNQKIKRGYMGVDLLISERFSRKMGYHASVLITRIHPQGPAEQSGLKAGDLIIGIGSENFRDSGALYRVLERSRPQESIEILYVRDKKSLTSTIRLSETPEPKNTTLNIGTADQAEKLGLILREAAANDGIEVVVSYGVAKTVGIISDDRIMQINGISINTIKELNTQLARLGENDIAMLSILRNGESIALPITSQKALKGYSIEN